MRSELVAAASHWNNLHLQRHAVSCALIGVAAVLKQLERSGRQGHIVRSHFEGYRFGEWVDAFAGWAERESCVEVESRCQPTGYDLQFGAEGGESDGLNQFKRPMSQAGPCGRAIPRWSVVTGFPNVSVQALSGIASRAVLDKVSAMVGVGPPLFCRPLGLSPAVALLFWSPVWVRKVQVLSSDRLIHLTDCSRSRRSFRPRIDLREAYSSVSGCRR